MFKFKEFKEMVWRKRKEVIVLLITSAVATFVLLQGGNIIKENNTEENLDEIAHYEPGDLIRNSRGHFGLVVKKNEDGSVGVMYIVPDKLTAPVDFYIPESDPSYKNYMDAVSTLMGPQY